MDGWNRVSLENLSNGAGVELFNSALAECHANILDPNTDRSKVREVHLVVKMVPDKNEATKIAYHMQVTKKLAPHPGVANFMYIGMEQGEIVGYEQTGVQPPLPGMEGDNVVKFKNANGGSL